MGWSSISADEVGLHGWFMVSQLLFGGFFFFDPVEEEGEEEPDPPLMDDEGGNMATGQEEVGDKAATGKMGID